jgi:hypothetical protein
VLLFVGIVIGELRVIQEQVNCHHPLQWEKYASFAKQLSRKMEQQIVAVIVGELCFHHCMIVLESSNGC